MGLDESWIRLSVGLEDAGDVERRIWCKRLMRFEVTPASSHVSQVSTAGLLVQIASRLISAPQERQMPIRARRQAHQSARSIDASVSVPLDTRIIRKSVSARKGSALAGRSGSSRFLRVSIPRATTKSRLEGDSVASSYKLSCALFKSLASLAGQKSCPTYR